MFHDHVFIPRQAKWLGNRVNTLPEKLPRPVGSEEKGLHPEQIVAYCNSLSTVGICQVCRLNIGDCTFILKVILSLCLKMAITYSKYGLN